MASKDKTVFAAPFFLDSCPEDSRGFRLHPLARTGELAGPQNPLARTCELPGPRSFPQQPCSQPLASSPALEILPPEPSSHALTRTSELTGLRTPLPRTSEPASPRNPAGEDRRARRSSKLLHPQPLVRRARQSSKFPHPQTPAQRQLLPEASRAASGEDRRARRPSQPPWQPCSQFQPHAQLHTCCSFFPD